MVPNQWTGEFRLKDKILVNNMRKQRGTKNIGYKIKKLKLKYAGHMARGDSEKCTLDPKGV